jgi:hypothetical protein
LGLENVDALPDLLIWEGHVVVSNFQTMTVFTNDGNRLWERAMLLGSPLAAANGLIYYENKQLELDAVNPGNELVLDSAPLPAVMNHDFRVTMLWPRMEDFINVIFWPGHEPEEKPEMFVRKTLFGEDMGRWGGQYEAMQQLSPLFIPELQQLVLSIYKQEVMCIDIEQETTMPRFKIPLDELSDWSADNEGTLCILGYQGANKVMLALSLAGEEKWRWSDIETPDRWVPAQPPIHSGNQRVYALSDSRVLAIEQGNLLWQYKVKNGIAKRGSSLADGSLLVSAGKTLIHLDSTGNERFLVSLDNEILTPPVVDADGNIYVATATHLVQIK